MSAGEEFLRRLFNEMQKRYVVEREMRREKLEKEYGSRAVFVHELLECSYKQKMKSRFPEIDTASTFNPRYVVGWLIEEGVRSIMKAKPAQWHKYLEDVNIVIAGEADLITLDGKVVETKFLSSLYGTPHEHHVAQLKLESHKEN